MEVIILKIQEKMVEQVLMMIHQYHHHLGLLVVVIIHVVVELLLIEYDLMMIGHYSCYAELIQVIYFFFPAYAAIYCYEKRDPPIVGYLDRFFQIHLLYIISYDHWTGGLRTA